jgi:hypothetical protein
LVGLTLILEATMPSITLQVIHALFPSHLVRRCAYGLYFRRAISARSLVVTLKEYVA